MNNNIKQAFNKHFESKIDLISDKFVDIIINNENKEEVENFLYGHFLTVDILVELIESGYMDSSEIIKACILIFSKITEKLFEKGIGDGL